MIDANKEVGASPLHSRAVPLAPRLGLAVLGGLLLMAGYALHPIWWAPWLAPIPILIAANGARREAAMVGAIAGVTAVAGQLPYYAEISGTIPAIVIGLLRTASWAMFALFAWAAMRRFPLALAMIVLPVGVAALEMISLASSPHGAAGSLAYSQMDFTGAIQVAALGGVPAIVFLVLLPGSLAGLLIARRWSPAARALAMASCGVVLLGVAVFSVMRLERPVPVAQIPVTLLASNGPRASTPDWAALWKAYEPAIAANARPGGLVVLPEKLAVLDRDAAGAAARDVSAAAIARRTTIVAGLEVRDGTRFRNTAMIATPDGALRWYDKQRLVPGWEDRDTPGHSPLVLNAMGTRLGIAICKDMHVPSIARGYAGNATVMAVPAWDFGQDGWMGARMTALRAVENGYAIARSARDGFAGIYDPFGRVVAERLVGTDMLVLSASLPAGGAPTLYALIGDAFGWGCVIVATLLAAMMLAGGVSARRASARALTVGDVAA